MPFHSFTTSGLHKTFETFQTEWYDMLQSGALESKETVPDCYVANTRLEEQVKRLQRDLDHHAAEAGKAAATAETLTKERDFHRASHRCARCRNSWFPFFLISLRS